MSEASPYLVIFFSFFLIPPFVETVLLLLKAKVLYAEIASFITIFILLQITLWPLANLSFSQNILRSIPVFLGILLSIKLSKFIRRKLRVGKSPIEIWLNRGLDQDSDKEER
jgi:hypothetical protein